MERTSTFHVDAASRDDAGLDSASIEAGLFFIVGAPRSGTTLVQAILCAGQNIFIPPETEFFMSFEPPADALDERRWSEYLARFFESQAWLDQGLDRDLFQEKASATDRTARSVFLTLLLMHARRSGRPRIGEKSPHHCRHVARLAKLFPSAKFIHIHRDPRDVVASQMRMPWGRGSSLDRARSWTRLMQEQRRVAQSLPASRYLTVKYETLVTDPQAQTQRMCAFLGEPFTDSMLEFHQRSEKGYAGREEAWKGATRSPIDASMIGRHRQQLTLRQIAGVQRIAGPMMETLGYEQAPIRTKALWRALDALDRIGDLVAKWSRSFRKRLSKQERKAP